MGKSSVHGGLIDLPRSATQEMTEQIRNLEMEKVFKKNLFRLNQIFIYLIFIYRESGKDLFLKKKKKEKKKKVVHE